MQPGRAAKPATAISSATDLLDPGEIMLLEMHMPGPRYGFSADQGQLGYIPVEWWEHIFAAIKDATDRGILVVQAAGNGREDLDDPLFDATASGFSPSWRNPFRRAGDPSLDSDAILAGAGACPAARGHFDRERLDFSNHGSCLDAQGWGESVVTAGYGDLQDDPSQLRKYAATFGGTSGAAPVVAGALACVQGILRARGVPPLTPAEARAAALHGLAAAMAPRQGARIRARRQPSGPQGARPGSRRPAGDRMTTRLVAVAILWSALASATAHAATATTPTGPTAFRVAGSCEGARITIRARSAPHMPLAIRTTATSPAGQEWSVSWDNPRPPQDEAANAIQNEWTSTGTVHGGAGCPSADRPVTLVLSLLFDATGGESAAFPIVVNPGQPSLVAPERWTVPIAAYPALLSFLNRSTTVEIPVREGSHVAPIAGVSAISTAGLIDGRAEPSEARLEAPTHAIDLPAGRPGIVSMPLSGTPGPGTFAARVALFGDGLAKETNVDLTIEVRTYRWALLLTVCIGVLAGWLVNVRLKGMRSADAARLKARRAALAIAGQASLIRDPVVQERMAQIGSDLVRAVDENPAVADLDARITQAQGSARDLATAANQAAESLRAAIARTREVIAPASEPKTITERLARAATTFDQIVGQANAGLVTDAQRALDAFNENLPRVTAEALRPWLKSVYRGLHAFGKWSDPQQEPERTRQAQIDGVRDAAKADAAGLPKECRAIALALTNWLELDGCGKLADALLAAAMETAVEHPESARALTELASELNGSSPDDPLSSLEQIADIGRRVTPILRNLVTGKPELDQRLSVGDFAAVLAALPTAPPTQQMVQVGVPTSPPAASGLEFGAAPPPGRPRIVVPRVLAVHQDAEARIVWPPAWVGARDDVVWRIKEVGGAVATSPGTDVVSLSPRHPGEMLVAAAVANQDLAPVTVLVRPSPSLASYASDERGLASRLMLIDNVGQGIAAVFTVFAGYLVFSPSWFGTGSDYLSVLAWGLFGQFGLSRITEITSPIVRRGLPTQA